ncbi:O-antigen polymerase [Aquicoccus porphyridii]|uniref:O-antigen polymerase n=1 Tax=Aquicoccus porphyridii TaxID=1852029 RepID=UPI001FE6C08C|nr:O-antigen polymerase [Aquicoccus porphyridii]
MSDTALHQRLDATQARNPFVRISNSARILIAVYFLFWRLLPSISGLDAQTVAHAGYTIRIAILTGATELLILLPFLMKRFSGTPIGWLHPLIMPTMFGVAFGLLRNPASLLTPISIWFQTESVPDHILLNHWPDSQVLAAQLQLNFINLLALVCTYAGFAMVRTRRRPKSGRPIRVDGFKLSIFFLLCLLVVMYFLQSQGGILNHIATLAYGRFRMRELSGHFLVINGFLPYVMLLWYAYQPKALRSPLFLLGFVIALLLQFVVTGSRSGLFSPIALLLAVWMFHNHRLPALRGMLSGLVAILMLGALGDIRRSGFSGSVDFSALFEFRVTSAWEDTQEELEARSTDTGLAVAALVPDQRSFLYGNTYVAALAFWVPRSLWQGKPRGAGAHAAALLFGGRDTMDGYQGGGYPVSGGPEAYWNFGYLGVIGIFGLFGMVLSAASRWVCRDPENPYALIALLIVNFGLTTPSTTAIVPVLQTMVLLYLLYLFASRLRVTR